MATMSILEAISPTARELLKSEGRDPKAENSAGGGVNIHKTSGGGRKKIHLSSPERRPVCGGGNSARSAQWQECILEANCRRCLEIRERKFLLTAENAKSAEDKYA